MCVCVCVCVCACVCSLTTQCGLPLLLSFTIDLVFEGELCNDCKLCNLLLLHSP